MTDSATQPRPAECFCVCCEEAKRCYELHFKTKRDCVEHFLADQNRRRENGCTLPSPQIFSNDTTKSAKLLEGIMRHIEHTIALIESRAEEEPQNFSDD